MKEINESNFLAFKAGIQEGVDFVKREIINTIILRERLYSNLPEYPNSFNTLNRLKVDIENIKITNLEEYAK